MKKTFGFLIFLFCFHFSFAQKVEIQTLLKDDISIRALQVYNGKVWYSGTDSKFGYVNLKDPTDQKQIKLFSKNLQFRTLGQNRKNFFAINIESPAYFFKIDKKSLAVQIVFKDTLKTAFYDALKFTDHHYAISFSDPTANKKLNISTTKDGGEHWNHCYDCESFPILDSGEAAFAASNSNIASKEETIWIATGGTKSRILKSKDQGSEWQVYETPLIQGTSSQGIYSIDFFDKNFGIAVGGDYTKQAENINNIATTNDGGETWQVQASGKNGGYKTCVKFRPKSKGKDIIAVGDQNIEFSSDYGKTWTTISEEKGLFVCEWIDTNTLVFAGKDRIVKMTLR